MKNVKPRIKGPVVRVAEKQKEYTAVDVIPARNKNFVWICPQCGMSRKPSSELCRGTPEAPHHTVMAKQGWNTVIMAFEPSPEQRQQIINGEDIYIALLTGGRPQQPIMLSVGPADMANWHGLEVERKNTPPVLKLEAGDNVECSSSQGDGASGLTSSEGAET